MLRQNQHVSGNQKNQSRRDPAAEPQNSLKPRESEYREYCGGESRHEACLPKCLTLIGNDGLRGFCRPALRRKIRNARSAIHRDTQRRQHQYTHSGRHTPEKLTFGFLSAVLRFLFSAFKERIHPVRGENGQRDLKYLEEFIRITNVVYDRQLVEKRIERRVFAESQQQRNKGRPAPEKNLCAMRRAAAGKERKQRKGDRNKTDVGALHHKIHVALMRLLPSGRLSGAAPVRTVRLTAAPAVITGRDKRNNLIRRKAPLGDVFPFLLRRLGLHLCRVFDVQFIPAQQRTGRKKQRHHGGRDQDLKPFQQPEAFSLPETKKKIRPGKKCKKKRHIRLLYKHQTDATAPKYAASPRGRSSTQHRTDKKEHHEGFLHMPGIKQREITSQPESRQSTAQCGPHTQLPPEGGQKNNRGRQTGQSANQVVPDNAGGDGFQ